MKDDSVIDCALTLELGLVLNDEGVVFVDHGLGELGGNGVVSSFVLEDKTLVSLNTTEDTWLLDGPGTDVSPLLFSSLLLGVRGLPSRLPVVGELLEEVCLERGGLRRVSAWCPLRT